MNRGDEGKGEERQVEEARRVGRCSLSTASVESRVSSNVSSGERKLNGFRRRATDNVVPVASPCTERRCIITMKHTNKTPPTGSSCDGCMKMRCLFHLQCEVKQYMVRNWPAYVSPRNALSKRPYSISWCYPCQVRASERCHCHCPYVDTHLCRGVYQGYTIYSTLEG